MKAPKWTPGRKESTRDQSLVVNEPDRPTEFEVQATIWHGLRAMGINARGEVKTAFAGRAQVRFDIAIFVDGQLAGVVEVKAAPIAHATNWQDTRQGYRYQQFGVPVRIVYGMEQAETLLADAAAGRLWDDVLP